MPILRSLEQSHFFSSAKDIIVQPSTSLLVVQWRLLFPDKSATFCLRKTHRTVTSEGTKTGQFGSAPVSVG